MPLMEGSPDQINEQKEECLNKHYNDFSFYGEAQPYSAQLRDIDGAEEEVSQAESTPMPSGKEAMEKKTSLRKNLLMTDTVKHKRDPSKR